MSIYKPGAHNYKFWLRCLVAVCFCFSLLGGHPAAAAPTPVKVGYFYDADYMSKKDGVYKGYNLDYLYSVANYANWEYQFIDYQGFSEAYAALQKGEIDVLPSLFYSPERAGQILFADDNMGRVYVTLVVGENDVTHGFNDFDSFIGMRVGILAGSLDAQAFLKWSAATIYSLVSPPLPRRRDVRRPGKRTGGRPGYHLSGQQQQIPHRGGV
jgi:ABC-type amino acid transport substrate-binding protein